VLKVVHLAEKMAAERADWTVFVRAVHWEQNWAVLMVVMSVSRWVEKMAVSLVDGRAVSMVGGKAVSKAAWTV